MNDGSAGKPKDGDPKACYVPIEVSDGTAKVDLRQVSYAVATVAAAIRESDLPDHFAEQVEHAGTPTSS